MSDFCGVVLAVIMLSSGSVLLGRKRFLFLNRFDYFGGHRRSNEMRHYKMLYKGRC